MRDITPKPRCDLSFVLCFGCICENTISKAERQAYYKVHGKLRRHLQPGLPGTGAHWQWRPGSLTGGRWRSASCDPAYVGHASTCLCPQSIGFYHTPTLLMKAQSTYRCTKHSHHRQNISQSLACNTRRILICRRLPYFTKRCTLATGLSHVPASLLRQSHQVTRKKSC